MKLRTRTIAMLAITFLAPSLYADASKPVAATLKKDRAANALSARAIAAEPKPVPAAAPLPKPLPAEPRQQPASTSSSTPRFELFLGYSFLRNIPVDPANRIAWLHGGSTSFAVNLNRHVGIVFDFAGFHADRYGPLAPPNGGVIDASGNVFTYMLGPRISFRHERFTPFVQALFGAVHAANVSLNGCTGIGCSPLPTDNTFAMSAGGGLDITLQRHIALRLFQAEYFMTRFAEPSPAGPKREHQNDMRLSTGLVFRFGGGSAPAPPPARAAVATCSAEKSMVYAGSDETVAVRADASDPNNNPLTYSWSTSDGAIDGSGPTVRWNSAAKGPGVHTVTAHVDNGHGGSAECSAEIRVEPQPNRAPLLTCSADRRSVTVGETVQITGVASDPDNDRLTFTWSLSRGPDSALAGSGSSARLATYGLAPGGYQVTGRADDGRGRTATCSADVTVQAAPPPPEVAQLETRLALRSVYFPTGRPSASKPEGGLLDSQREVLESLATDFKRYLTFKPDARLILGGHADDRGLPEFNKELTERRVGLAKRFLVERGIASGNIETQSFGKEQSLNSDQVKQQMQENPELSAADRQKMLNNLPVIVLANNRRVDVSLSTTGQQSTRRYPFNAKDALALISTTGTGKQTTPAKGAGKQTAPTKVAKK